LHEWAWLDHLMLKVWEWALFWPIFLSVVPSVLQFGARWDLLLALLRSKDFRDRQGQSCVLSPFLKPAQCPTWGTTDSAGPSAGPGAQQCPSAGAGARDPRQLLAWTRANPGVPPGTPVFCA
jgi:hypothetical protein